MSFRCLAKFDGPGLIVKGVDQSELKGFLEAIAVRLNDPDNSDAGYFPEVGKPLVAKGLGVLPLEELEHTAAGVVALRRAVESVAAVCGLESGFAADVRRPRRGGRRVLQDPVYHWMISARHRDVLVRQRRAAGRARAQNQRVEDGASDFIPTAWSRELCDALLEWDRETLEIDLVGYVLPLAPGEAVWAESLSADLNGGAIVRSTASQWLVRGGRWLTIEIENATGPRLQVWRDQVEELLTRLEPGPTYAWLERAYARADDYAWTRSTELELRPDRFVEMLIAPLGQVVVWDSGSASEVWGNSLVCYERSR